MSAWNDKSGAYRYERKFDISMLSPERIEMLVRLHPGVFSENYPPRFINSIYLDSFMLRNFFDNICGIKERMKSRIRWYGEMLGMIKKPTLELKIKKDELGKKIAYPIAPFKITRGFSFDTIRGAIKETSLPSALRISILSLNCVVLVRYRRKYYQSADRKYRITIDGGIEFYQLFRHYNSFLHKSNGACRTILELKYDADESKDADFIAGHFPFRITKSSKYVSGIENVWL